MSAAAWDYSPDESAFYRWGVQGREDRRQFLHDLEAEAGIPAELSARWDATLERFGL